MFVYLQVGIPSESECLCPSLGMFFCSASCPSPASFLKDGGSSRFRGSDGYSGRNIVWMTNRAAIFAQFIQCSSSTVMVMIFTMKPSIDASVAVVSTSKGSDVTIWLAYFWFFSCGSKDWCGEFRSSVSQYSSQNRSLPRSIATSLTVIYSAGAGVVPKGKLKQIKSSWYTIAMHVNVIVVLACIWR